MLIKEVLGNSWEVAILVLPFLICNVSLVTAVLLYCQSCIKVHNVHISLNIGCFILLFFFFSYSYSSFFFFSSSSSSSFIIIIFFSSFLLLLLLLHLHTTELVGNNGCILDRWHGSNGRTVLHITFHGSTNWIFYQIINLLFYL